MNMRLAEIAHVLGVTPPAVDAVVEGWSTDTRTLARGDLFFALRGPNHDGHQHLAQAFERGAVAAVVDRDADAPGPLLRVADSLGALQDLARGARTRFTGAVVGVTGSAGKTTTKDTIAQLLSSALDVSKTVGNLNNHLGVPLSILRLRQDSQVAVIEMGMNHEGELRHLAAIARPTMAVITNVGYAHIEYFGSLEKTALAKRELVEALPSDGTAVLNADDALVARFREVHAGPTVTFGLGEGADVRATDVEYKPDGVSFRVSGLEFKSPLVGRHAVLNILAGLAVAGVFGIPPERLQQAALSLAAGHMRGERMECRGVTILNDCYNSNPDAVQAMLEVLQVTPARRRIAVLGEMLELGRWSEALHRDAGRCAVANRVDVLVGIRGAARYTLHGALDAGLPDSAAYFFEDPAPAGDFLRGIARPGDVILFKGSRGTRVEIALERFLAGNDG
ncbi:MAG: UDP-N-acetylmuramoyl-tripeptide--D-alanyl-D-alanine ligase [Bryobacteraceae bacterium]